jgi:hypothetical protein
MKRQVVYSYWFIPMGRLLEAERAGKRWRLVRRDGSDWLNQFTPYPCAPTPDCDVPVLVRKAGGYETFEEALGVALEFYATRVMPAREGDVEIRGLGGSWTDAEHATILLAYEPFV